MAVTATVAAATTMTVAGTITGAVAAVGSMAVIAFVAGDMIIATTDSMIPMIAIVGAVTVAEVGMSAYIGWRALARDEKFASVRKIALAFAAIGGTSFRGADLTDADFTQATLKSTDFRSNNFGNTILTRTRWHKAKNLELVRPGETYLRNAQLRPWLIGGRLGEGGQRYI